MEVIGIVLIAIGALIVGIGIGKSSNKPDPDSVGRQSWDFEREEE